MEAVKQFFEANPEATECYTALGYAYATYDAAKLTVVATTGKVEKWIKNDLQIVQEDQTTVLMIAKDVQIAKLEKELANANEMINRLGGEAKENKTTKKLQEEIKELKELVKMYELEGVKQADKVSEGLTSNQPPQ